VPIRFVVDENILAVGKALVEVRDDVTYFGDPGSARRGRPRCPIELGMRDDVWLPIAGRNEWAVITRDRHIRTRPGELAAVKQHSIRLFAITSKGQLNRWDLLGILVRRWASIEQQLVQGGPLVCSVTRDAVTPLVID
jgi:hypothetical protein